MRKVVARKAGHARETMRMAGAGNMSRHDMSGVPGAGSLVEIAGVAGAMRYAPCKGGSDAPGHSSDAIAWHQWCSNAGAECYT